MFSPKKKEKKTGPSEIRTKAFRLLIRALHHSATVITDLKRVEFYYFKLNKHQNACLGWKFLLDRF